MFYQQKRWITLECLEKLRPHKKTRAKKNTWSYCWEKQDIERSLEQFHGDVGNTFPVEIKFGDKSVRRGLLHLSITSRLRQKVPFSSIQERDSKIWDLSKAFTAYSSRKLYHVCDKVTFWDLNCNSLCSMPRARDCHIAMPGHNVAK